LQIGTVKFKINSLLTLLFFLIFLINATPSCFLPFASL